MSKKLTKEQKDLLKESVAKSVGIAITLAGAAAYATYKTVRLIDKIVHKD